MSKERAPALPPDPELAPVAAAQAFLAAQAQAAAAAPHPAPGPVIRPARPEQWQTVVTLAHPLEVDGAVIAALTIRRITAGQLADLIMADDGEESLNRRARALIAGVHPDVLDALDPDDAVAVMEAIRPFLPRALRAAETTEMELLAAAAARAGDGA
jgi:hypothetical protein